MSPTVHLIGSCPILSDAVARASSFPDERTAPIRLVVDAESHECASLPYGQARTEWMRLTTGQGGRAKAQPARGLPIKPRNSRAFP